MLHMDEHLRLMVEWKLLRFRCQQLNVVMNVDVDVAVAVADMDAAVFWAMRVAVVLVVSLSTMLRWWIGNQCR